MIEGTTARRTGRQDGMNGVLVAGITAVISGISVFANSYGVHHVPSPSVYTTGKNLVAFVALGAATLAASAWRRRSTARGEMATRWVAAPVRLSRAPPAPSRGWGWPTWASSAVAWPSCSSSTGSPAPRRRPPPSCTTPW